MCNPNYISSLGTVKSFEIYGFFIDVFQIIFLKKKIKYSIPNASVEYPHFQNIYKVDLLLVYLMTSKSIILMQELKKAK